MYADLLRGEIYKVDHEADDIAEAEAYDIWPLVEEADSYSNLLRQEASRNARELAYRRRCNRRCGVGSKVEAPTVR